MINFPEAPAVGDAVDSPEGWTWVHEGHGVWSYGTPPPPPPRPNSMYHDGTNPLIVFNNNDIDPSVDWTDGVERPFVLDWEPPTTAETYCDPQHSAQWPPWMTLDDLVDPMKWKTFKVLWNVTEEVRITSSGLAAMAGLEGVTGFYNTASGGFRLVLPNVGFVQKSHYGDSRVQLLVPRVVLAGPVGAVATFPMRKAFDDPLAIGLTDASAVDLTFEDYNPSKPVKMVDGVTPASWTDFVARITNGSLTLQCVGTDDWKLTS